MSANIHDTQFVRCSSYYVTKDAMRLNFIWLYVIQKVYDLINLYRRENNPNVYGYYLL